MKRTFTASIAQEGDWYIAQCFEVDVASQGETEDDALLIVVWPPGSHTNNGAAARATPITREIWFR